MRVTWLLVCERLVHLVDGTHHAHNMYVDDLHWSKPAAHIPLAVAFLLEGERTEELVAVSVRLLSPRGTVAAELGGKLKGRPGASAWPGFLEGNVMIESPGDYEIQAVAIGQPVDDAPTWRLRFVEQK